MSHSITERNDDMEGYFAPTTIDKYDLKRLRKKLVMTQVEFASLVNVSKKTVERWETSDKEITGPITTLYQLLINSPELSEQFEIPKMIYPLRLKYFF